MVTPSPLVLLVLVDCQRLVLLYSQIHSRFPIMVRRVCSPEAVANVRYSPCIAMLNASPQSCTSTWTTTQRHVDKVTPDPGFENISARALQEHGRALTSVRTEPRTMYVSSSLEPRAVPLIVSPADVRPCRHRTTGAATATAQEHRERHEYQRWHIGSATVPEPHRRGPQPATTWTA
jgi:hypothetical protein